MPARAVTDKQIDTHTHNEYRNQPCACIDDVLIDIQKVTYYVIAQCLGVRLMIVV